MFSPKGSAPMKKQEAKIGYWIGAPYWGYGLIPESVQKLQQRCFEDLGCTSMTATRNQNGYRKNADSDTIIQKRKSFLPWEICVQNILPG